jgi:hypothetical protein
MADDTAELGRFRYRPKQPIYKGFFFKALVLVRKRGIDGSCFVTSRRVRFGTFSCGIHWSFGHDPPFGETRQKTAA